MFPCQDTLGVVWNHYLDLIFSFATLHTHPYIYKTYLKGEKHNKGGDILKDFIHNREILQI